jgi:hypothetical protein
MRTRLLFWDEDEVRKKKTLILVLAFLLIPLLLGLYAAMGPEGGLIAEVTPTVFLSPGAVATATPLIPTLTATATPIAGVTPVAKASATPVLPKPAPSATFTPPIPTFTASAVPTAGATPVAEVTATPVSSRTSVPPEPTAPPTAPSVAFEPTPTPAIVPTAPPAAPMITTPLDGSVLRDDRPTIAGTAPPNTTVQVYDDERLIGTAVADAQGDWALILDEPLEPGEHTLTATASDDAGRTSDSSAEVTFTVAIDHLPVTGGSWFER